MIKILNRPFLGIKIDFMLLKVDKLIWLKLLWKLTVIIKNYT